MAGRIYVARHGETVFNAAERMQGELPHTPLTRQGFAQAEEMGLALKARLGPRPALELWASPTGRALQTLAIIAEHLELDWHQARTDARLTEMEMGTWGGRYYREILAESGEFVDRALGMFTTRPPGGEWYDDIARRLTGWIDELGSGEADRLIIMHGVSSRVMRGLLTGAADRPECRAPLMGPLPQGSIVMIEDGAETVIHLGSGGHGLSGSPSPAHGTPA